MDIKNTHQISKARQRLRSFSRDLSSLLNTIINTNAITKDTIYNQKKKCGNKNCKCTRGKLHHTKILSLSHESKTRLIPLTKFTFIELSRIEHQVRYYQRFRRARAEITRYFNTLLAEINKLGQNLLIEVAPKKGENNINSGL